MVRVPRWLESLEVARLLPPDATDNERAWSKFSVADTGNMLALVADFAERPHLAREYGKQCLQDSVDFLLGDWRNTYLAEDRRPDPKYWKCHFIWMQVFEGALLWGSVLGEWELLRKVGTFPESDSCISDGYRVQDRDLYVALGGFLRGAFPDELEALLERAATGTRNPASYWSHSYVLSGAGRERIERDACGVPQTLQEE